MKNRIIKIVSLLIVFSVITGLCSCKLAKKEVAGISTTHRPLTLPSSSSSSAKTTDLLVKAVVPKGEEAIIDYFNKSLKYFRENDFEFTRKKSTKLSSYSAGSLTSVSGATSSYVSALESACSDMMGVGSLDTSYFIGDDISAAFAIKEVSPDFLKKCSAVAEENRVNLTFEYNQYVGDDKTALSQLTGDYLTDGSFASNIRGYGASVSKATATVSGIKLSAVIDYSTRNFISIKIEFTTSFYVESVAFDYVSGGPVNGKTKTVISYGDFREK